MSASLSVQEIIDRWPNLAAFAADLGVEYGTAKQMRRRSSIAVAHWNRTIDGAATRGIEGITYEVLAKANAPQRPAPEPAGAAA